MQEELRYRNPLEILLCGRDDYAEALAVLYRRTPVSLRESLVRQSLEDVETGELDLSGLWVARRRGRILGSLLTQHLAGRAAAVWAPEVLRTWNRTTMATALVRCAVEALRSKGVALAQALLEHGSPRQAGLDLERGGVPRVTELCYLERSTRLSAVRRRSTPRMEWVSYSDQTDAMFREALEATYIDSLDMPELEGLRSLDDVLAGHRAAGRFVPDYWLLGRLPDEPQALAVLLLSGHPSRSSWEVAYLGLSPAARGRGLGHAALEHAFELVRSSADRLELAVDVRNTPACRLYESAGFTPFDRRIVHLVLLN